MCDGMLTGGVCSDSLLTHTVSLWRTSCYLQITVSQSFYFWLSQGFRIKL